MAISLCRGDNILCVAVNWRVCCASSVCNFVICAATRQYAPSFPTHTHTLTFIPLFPGICADLGKVANSNARINKLQLYDE